MGSGVGDNGDVFIPFTASAPDIPFARWQMVSTKIFESDGPIVVQSIILTHNGEVYIQYAKEINDAGEYPRESRKDVTIHSERAKDIDGSGLVQSDEKRSYE